MGFDCISCHFGCCNIHVSSQIPKSIFSLSDSSRSERIGFDYLCSCLEVEKMNLLDNIWSCHYKKIIVSREICIMIIQNIAAKVFLCQIISLNHRSHSAIYDDDSLI